MYARVCGCVCACVRACDDVIAVTLVKRSVRAVQGIGSAPPAASWIFVSAILNFAFPGLLTSLLAFSRKYSRRLVLLLCTWVVFRLIMILMYVVDERYGDNNDDRFAVKVCCVHARPPIPAQPRRYPSSPADTRPAPPIPAQPRQYPPSPANTCPTPPIPAQPRRYPPNLLLLCTNLT